MAVNIPIAVPLKAGLRKRFYEALVLAVCLKKVFTQGKQTEITERISDDEHVSGRKKLYHCFVNKMAREWNPLSPSALWCSSHKRIRNLRHQQGTRHRHRLRCLAAG